MANRSSNSRLLAIGFAVLVVGVVLVLLIIRNVEDQPAEPSPAVTDQDTTADEEPTESATPLTQDQLSTARMPLPLDVPDGTEAMAVRVNFMRSVAAVPTAGDVVNLYRLPESSDDDDGGQTGEDDTGQPATPTRGLPAPGPDARQVLEGVEVLAMTGPLPAANDGTLTVVLAVPTAEVAALMPLANDSELWLTLPATPDGDADATEQDTTDQGTPTDGTTEEPS